MHYKNHTFSDLFTHSLVFPRIVPDGSLQFQLCLRRDVIGVRDLLDSRKASVNDIDSEGKTLLHIASMYCDYEMVRLLLDAGANSAAVLYPSVEHP